MCAAPCRMKYTLYENDKKLIDSYLLSKKDIYGIDYVKRLIDIGVKSLKIEGRSKSYEYVSLVTSKYRKIIDNKKFDDNDELELLQMFNREGKSFGYLKQVENNTDNITLKSPKNTGIILRKSFRY